jgi:plasmid stabilization system protein ParE
VAKPRVVLHPGAAEDYEAAFSWYFARGVGVAADFEREIDRCLRLIAQSPLRWPKFDAERHRIVVRKFPYSIVYEMMGQHIMVLAIAHGRRRPYYWRERVGEE